MPVAEGDKALVRVGPAIAFSGSVCLAALLNVVIGASPWGWAVATLYSAGLILLLCRAIRSSGIGRLGPADCVTLVRASLIGPVTAMTADSLFTGGRPWALVGV